MTALFDAYVILVALLLGSFVNLAADRLPRRESLITPRSHCRRCGRRLNAVDLMPVLGFIFRAGRCATCRAPIGWSAPIVEAVCGACMAGPILFQGLWPGTITGAILVVLYGSTVTALALWRTRQT